MNRNVIVANDTKPYPPGNYDQALEIGSKLAIIVIGIVTFAVAMELGQFLFAPVSLAIVLGLMFGPVADRIERLGIPPAISAIAIVIMFMIFIVGSATAFAVPLTAWFDRLPRIWAQFQSEIADWRDILSSISSLQETLREATGSEGMMSVSVDGGSAVENVAFIAPSIGAQMLIFLASLYFFIATRHDVRLVALSLCTDRRLRWRAAHVFRDTERLVSRYLLSISVVNAGLGLAVGLAMWAAGIPSPILWGVLAGVLNFIIYIGPAMMAVILFCVGLATSSGIGILLPPGIYLALNLMEAQFITPTVLGRVMTLNPLVVFLSLAFWIWIWGPIGGFIAVPSLLVIISIGRHILPTKPLPPRKKPRRRRTVQVNPNFTEPT